MWGHWLLLLLLQLLVGSSLALMMALQIILRLEPPLWMVGMGVRQARLQQTLCVHLLLLLSGRLTAIQVMQMGWLGCEKLGLKDFI